MEEHERLQWFLIKKFILLLVAVGITEYALLWLINQFILPTITRYFFPQARGRLTLSGFQVVAILVLVLFTAVVQGIGHLLPMQVASVLQWLGDGLESLTGRVSPSAWGETAVVQMNDQRRMLFLLFLFVTVFLLMLPFVAGAFAYARIVMREFARLQELKEEAKREYDRKRNLMLSDIAHDLRTPITTVSGYAAALSDGLVAPERQQEYLDAIRSKSVRMNDLISLLFDYVKLDSDGFVLEKTPIDLCELARENAALLYSDIERARMELDISIPEERIEVTADRLQLSRVVTNLLVNAMRHNPPGTRIGLQISADEERILAAVADTGDGIPDGLADHLFEPFARGDVSRRGGGSGLGLSIAQKVVQMHGWELILVRQPELKKYGGLTQYEKAFLICIDIS